ncbi:hypothetical protein ACFFX0_27015 [Citricoccus parietis]|uniref:Uncharacterized protein n=1 Tax=Citricoccus parietis TaxID=592307 RepID=A0ABV5G6S0_9MICC
MSTGARSVTPALISASPSARSSPQSRNTWKLGHGPPKLWPK